MKFRNKKTGEIKEFNCIEINSSRLSAQNRKRLYWTNIPNITQPEDKGILLKDVLEYGEYDRDKNYCIDANYFKGGSVKNYKEKKRRQLVQVPVKIHQSEKRLMVKVKTIPHGYIKESVDVKDKYPSLCAQDPSSKHKLCIQIGEADLKGMDIIKRVYSPEGKAPTLSTMQGGHREPKVSEDNITWRKLTPLECERLQTAPDNYTLVPHPVYKNKMMSNSQRYKMLGNGFTIDVLAHIFKNIS